VSSSTSVALRSLTVTTSAPPRALKSDPLGHAGAVEDHRVEAGLALDHVASVAWIPGEGVVAGAHQRDVVAGVAVDRVVSEPAEQRLDTPAAGEGVVSSSAGERRRDLVGEDPVGLVDAHEVVARAAADRDPRDLAA
jgi:hypothetical protein